MSTNKQECCDKCVSHIHEMCMNPSCPCHRSAEKELHDCSGCTDTHSEGTHQMHTKQHPCPEGGDPNCGYCFPTTNTSDWRERFDYLLYNFKNAVRHDVEGTNIGPYKNELVNAKAALFAFIAAEIEAALVQGGKIGFEAGRKYDEKNLRIRSGGIEAVGDRAFKAGHTAAIAEVKEMIGWMKKEVAKDAPENIFLFQQGFNKALSDLLTKLTGTKH